MYICDITVHPTIDLLEAGHREEFDTALLYLLGSLRGRDRILYEGSSTVRTKDAVTVRVITPFADSLDEAYDSPEDTLRRREVEEAAGAPLTVTVVGEDWDHADDVSTGRLAEEYILCIHAHVRSPIRCGHCARPIPSYLLPPLGMETRFGLGEWLPEYEALDRLFWIFGYAQSYAHHMMSDVGSPLNRRGLELCRLLEPELGKPVYYYLYRYYGSHPDNCPICGNRWRLDLPTDAGYDYRCDPCRLVAHEPMWTELDEEPPVL